MEIYRIAGKKAAVLLDPFEIPAKAILTGVQLDRGGSDDVDDSLYVYFCLTVTHIPTHNRDPKIVKRQLRFYNGILKFLPGLGNALDNMTQQQVSRIVQAVHICAYMHTI